MVWQYTSELIVRRSTKGSNTKHHSCLPFKSLVDIIARILMRRTTPPK
jgi:hypothetical protein